MYDTQVGQEVRASFQALASNAAAFTESDTALLRRRIEAAVDDLRSMGWPIERIIVRIKEVAWEVGVRLGHRPNQADLHPVIAQTVRWSIERYYAPIAKDEKS